MLRRKKNEVYNEKKKREKNTLRSKRERERERAHGKLNASVTLTDSGSSRAHRRTICA